MFDIERWQEIFDTIRKNALRTFLTGVSVASGIFILVILLGFGQGMQNGVAEEFKTDAATSIWVWPGRTTLAHDGMNPGRRVQLRNGDFEVVQNQLDVDYAHASTFFFPPIQSLNYGNEVLTYTVIGTTPDIQPIENEFMVMGRYLNEADMRQNTKVAVIGYRILEELFEDGQDPLGEYLTINGANFKIVGVYGEVGDDEDEEERIFIPLSTAHVAFNGGDRLDNLTFMLPPQDNLDDAVAQADAFIEEVEGYLKEKHSVSPEDDRAIRFWNPMAEAKRYYSLMGNIKIFFWFVGVCTIIAGVVGVSNIMLIVVKERTREIGIRKALGARPWTIVGMILHEAIFVTAISGFTGLILSMGLLELVGPNVEIDYVVNPNVSFQVAFATVVVLIVAGTLAGFFPSWRAAKIQVIEALRDE